MKFQPKQIVKVSHELAWIKTVFNPISEILVEDIFGNTWRVSFDECEIVGNANNFFEFHDFVLNHD
jgi:hypothetical protein